MASWIAVALTALGLVGSLAMVLVRVSNAVSGNTQAIRTLTDYLDKQEGRLKEHEESIVSLAERVKVIETVHSMRGCNEVDS